jgi:hypothetical protein
MEQVILNQHLANIRGILITKVSPGTPVEPPKIFEIINGYESMMGDVNFTKDEKQYIAFRIGSTFDVSLSDKATMINSINVKRWFDNAKTEFSWEYWNAYKDLLLSQDRALDVIDENERVIDNILDLSGDPRLEGRWNRRGLVMGNVQSGKTQNYLGLINKAIDCGYKIIILLGGGNSNALRKQTQSRVDEGVIGRQSKHLITQSSERNIKIGVGLHRDRDKLVETMTSTENDFSKPIARQLGISLKSLNSPIIFTLKKNTSIMQNLHDWIKEFHDLDPENNLRLDLPMMLIDDEADFATPNSRREFEEVTRTNKLIRQTITLFNQSTYIGYTATPFANIFIHPESFDEALGDDLYPEDFMIRVPTPDQYLGQNFYFENQNLEVIHPIEIIDDNEEMFPMTGQKKDTPVGPISNSLKEAIRAFIISSSIRDSRGQQDDHKSMLVNITHLNVPQGQITNNIEEYLKELKRSINYVDGLSYDESMLKQSIKDLFKTFNTEFDVPETFDVALHHINKAINKIKVFGVNADTGVEVDYSLYDKGLSAIIVGGYKLSRGLTLEGLSVSYFARNSKAYDTLMQMCRWFGYRQGYKDLCKVYLPSQSNEWYIHISNAINDLYRELQRMENQQKTPRDFGLKVRSHSGALTVTARNRMQTAESSIIKIDLWGQRLRRFRYSPETNHKQNLELSEKFIKKIQHGLTPETIAPTNSIIFDGVGHDEVIEYIRSLDLVEDDFGNEALFHQIRTMKENGLPKFKLCIKNLINTSKLKWEADDRFKEINLEEQYKFCGHDVNLQKRNMDSNGKVYFYPGAEMGSQTDEGLFLSESEVKKINDKYTRINPLNYISSEKRDFPGIIIYLFSPVHIDKYKPSKVEEINTINMISEHPVIGVSISFPILEHHAGLDTRELKALRDASQTAYDTTVKYRQLELIMQSEDELENGD